MPYTGACVSKQRHPTSVRLSQWMHPLSQWMHRLQSCICHSLVCCPSSATWKCSQDFPFEFWDHVGTWLPPPIAYFRWPIQLIIKKSTSDLARVGSRTILHWEITGRRRRRRWRTRRRGRRCRIIMKGISYITSHLSFYSLVHICYFIDCPVLLGLV